MDDQRIEQVAQICHETNRAYCETIGDMSQPDWGDAPDWQKDSARNGIRFHLHSLEQGAESSPSASHENWLKEKLEAGWTYGPIKDPEKKLHPCCVPYSELPLEQRLKDYLFYGIIKAFWLAEHAIG